MHKTIKFSKIHVYIVLICDFLKIIVFIFILGGKNNAQDN